MFDPNDYRHLFPITQHYVYLNHAAMTPPSTVVSAAVNEYLSDYAQHGSVSDKLWLGRFDEAHNEVAGIINAQPSEVAFVRSVSDGLSLISNGLNWRRGDNVVGVDGEFPANVYPWLNLARHGVETRLVPQRDNRVLVEDIAAAIDARTRVVAIGFVEFNTGFRTDLAAIGRLCHERGVYFVVDPMQGLGALPFDVKALGIDFLACGSHKWLMGVHGAGIFYARQEALERAELATANLSWYSVSDNMNFAYRLTDAHPNARRFDAASPVILEVWALVQAQRLVASIGREEIASHILGLTAQLIAGLERLGYEVISPHASDAERSGIVCFKPRPGQGSNVELTERLLAQGIVVAARSGIVRVSPHFYNTEGEIERLLEALEGVSPKSPATHPAR